MEDPLEALQATANKKPVEVRTGNVNPVDNTQLVPPQVPSEDWAKTFTNALVQGITPLLTRPEGSEKQGSKAKRKADLEQEDSEADIPLLFDRMVHLQDDCVTKVDLELRTILRAPRAEPETWWNQRTNTRHSRPAVSDLHLEPCLGSNTLSEFTSRKIHDRCAILNYKYFLTKNSQAHGSSKRAHVLVGECCKVDNIDL